MFFFGSISTFLPYLIYISVVWICVLIGFRGQFFSNFLPPNQAKAKAIVESNENNAEKNCYVLSYKDTEDFISQNKSIIQKRFFDFFRTGISKFKYLVLPDKVYQHVRISGNLLRAPPYLSV